LNKPGTKIAVQVTTKNTMTDGVIEMTAVENYYNPFTDTDDLIDGNIERIETILEEDSIQGENLLHVYEQYTFTYTGTPIDDRWQATGVGTIISVVSKTNSTLTIKTINSGDFTLYKDGHQRTIRVDSLFK